MLQMKRFIAENVYLFHFNWHGDISLTLLYNSAKNEHVTKKSYGHMYGGPKVNLFSRHQHFFSSHPQFLV